MILSAPPSSATSLLTSSLAAGAIPDDFDAHFENMQDALRGGAMSETVSSLSSSIEDVVFDVLNECETFQTEAE